MKHRPLLFPALPLLFLAMALVAIRSFSGSGGIASADVNTGAPHMEIDLVKETGEAWCQSITTEASRTDGSTYQIAICLSDAADLDGIGTPPWGFQFDLKYNPALDSCTDVTGSPLDGNPDANTGTNTFSTPSLGTGWNCNVQDVAPPTCAKGGTAGTAFLKCLTTLGTKTLPAGNGISAPLAVVTLAAIANGTDNLALVNASAFGAGAVSIMGCGPTGGATCKGATEEKTVGQPPANTATPTATLTPTIAPTECPNRVCPTSTPTARAKTRTPTPEATGTPAPGGPTSAPPPPPPPPSGGQQPVVVPPATGTGSGSIGWTGILMWTLTGGAAFSLILGGGLYLRRVTNR